MIARVSTLTACAAAATMLSACGSDPIVGHWQGLNQSTGDLDIQVSNGEKFAGDGHIYIQDSVDASIHHCSFNASGTVVGDAEWSIDVTFTGECKVYQGYSNIACSIPIEDTLICVTEQDVTLGYSRTVE